MTQHSEVRDVGSPDRSAFMVEAFRPAGSAPLPAKPIEDGSRVVAEIDIPSDEMTLFVVASADADAAVGLIRGMGLETIRVMEVRWSVSEAPEALASRRWPASSSSTP